MNFRKIVLPISMLGIGILFAGCETSLNNNGIENVSEEDVNLVVITEKNKNKSIEITDTPITIRNEVFGFEVELGEDWSGGKAHPNIRGYDFESFSGGQYTFELDSMSQVIVFEFWEKNDFLEKELDPSDKNDKERLRNHNHHELDGIKYKKIVSKSGEIPKYKWLGYKGNTEYGIFGENNRYYFSIHDIDNRLINEYFKNNSCYDKTFYNEILEYSYEVRVCPNALTDIFNGGFKIFDVE